MDIIGITIFLPGGVNMSEFNLKFAYRSVGIVIKKRRHKSPGDGSF